MEILKGLYTKINIFCLSEKLKGMMYFNTNAMYNYKPECLQKRRMGSTTHPFLIKLTNLTKPKLMKINVTQRYTVVTLNAIPTC